MRGVSLLLLPLLGVIRDNYAVNCVLYDDYAVPGDDGGDCDGHDGHGKEDMEEECLRGVRRVSMLKVMLIVVSDG